MRIYTLGTDNLTPYEFTRLLSKYQIKVIFDVRRFPTSKLEHFKRENLLKICGDAGVKYVYLGSELGGFRKEGFKKYMEGREFKRGIELILKIAGQDASAILCAERLPFRCHRRFIANALTLKGREVLHILTEDEVLKHKISAQPK